MFAFHRLLSVSTIVISTAALCLCACGSDEEDSDCSGGTGGTAGSAAVAGNTISGTVSYSGSKVGKLSIVAFTSWPAISAPSAMAGVAEPTFPQDYELTNVAAGNYYVVAILDVDPPSPMVPGDEDRMSVPGEAVSVTDGQGAHLDITISE